MNLFEKSVSLAREVTGTLAVVASCCSSSVRKSNA